MLTSATACAVALDGAHVNARVVVRPQRPAPLGDPSVMVDVLVRIGEVVGGHQQHRVYMRVPRVRVLVVGDFERTKPASNHTPWLALVSAVHHARPRLQNRGNRIPQPIAGDVFHCEREEDGDELARMVSIHPIHDFADLREGDERLAPLAHGAKAVAAELRRLQLARDLARLGVHNIAEHEVVRATVHTVGALLEESPLARVLVPEPVHAGGYRAAGHLLPLHGLFLPIADVSSSWACSIRSGCVVS